MARGRRLSLLVTALLVLTVMAFPGGGVRHSVAATVQTSACVQPPADLVSWWPGDGTAHDIWGPNNGALYSGATYAPGEVGQAFHFDGLNAYFQSASADLPTGSSARTLELWVREDAIPPVEGFFAGYGAFGVNNAAYELFSTNYNGSQHNDVDFSQWGEQIEGPPLTAGVWYHVAVTNVGNTITLYLNGQAVASGTWPISTANATPFYMGRIPGPLGDTRRLTGLVDEVAVYKRALSAQEIQALYTAGSAGKCKPTAALAVSPTSGSFEQTVTLTGTAFSPHEIVTIHADSITASGIYTATTDPRGAFVITRRVLQGIYGDHELIAVGQSSGHQGVAPFVETARLIMKPSSGAVGATLAASGYGFGPHETVRVQWSNPTTLEGTATTNSLGTFSGASAVTFTIPSGAPLGYNQVFGGGQTSRAIGSGLVYVH